MFLTQNQFPQARTIDYWEVGSSRVDIGTTETGNGEISTNFVDLVCPISPLIYIDLTWRNFRYYHTLPGAPNIHTGHTGSAVSIFSSEWFGASWLMVQLTINMIMYIIFLLRLLERWFYSLACTHSIGGWLQCDDIMISGPILYKYHMNSKQCYVNSKHSIKC